MSEAQTSDRAEAIEKAASDLQDKIQTCAGMASLLNVAFDRFLELMPTLTEGTRDDHETAFSALDTAVLQSGKAAQDALEAYGQFNSTWRVEA